jgi:hypothetical protein
MVVRGSTLTAALAVLVAVAVAACSGGSGGAPLSRSAFLGKVNGECAALKQASDDFAKAQSPSATGTRVASLLKKAAARLRSLAGEMSGVTPPDALSRKFDTLVSVLRSYADGLDTLAGKVRSGQTLQDTLNANAALVSKLNKFSDQATTTVADLGLTRCILTA